MASVTTPTIKKIIRLNNYDLLGTKNNKYCMYMCLDTLQLWYDESESKRVLYAYVGVNTINDLENNIIPELGVTYYCWESNSLWLWMNRWVCIYTDSTYPSAYRTDNGYVEEVYLDDQNPTIVDNNGLLKDGSVVIRDANRVIKGRLYISDRYDNLVLSSYLGGGMRILPNGTMSSEGELLIDDAGVSHIRAQWNVLNNEIYVDYSEKPDDDKSKYIREEHRYKVWHEGNLKLDDLDFTGKNIVDKIQEAVADGSLTEPLPFNVDKLDGLHASDFALKNHVHSAGDIADFNEQAQAQAEKALRNRLTDMIFRGAKITWVEAQQKFMLSTDTFILAFTGGAEGQGTVTNNTNTTIALDIDPDKHHHKDLEDRISALEAGGGGGGDLSNYYTKKQTEDLVNGMFSTAPVPGRALLVDSNRDLPGNAKTASDLSHDTVFELTGDITGTGTLSYDMLRFSLSTNADKIVSTTAEANKALRLDNNKNLNANAQTASALNHDINVALKGDISGTGVLDTGEDSFEMITTFNAPDYVLVEDDLGNTVASLDKNGIIYENQLPAGLTGALKMIGNWSGTTAPSSNPMEGQLWEVSADCIFNGVKYRKGEWIYYHNNSWHRADMTPAVKSINGKTGEDLTLDASIFDAVPYTYVDYTPGVTVPEGKAVVTDRAGHIAGATDAIRRDLKVNSSAVEFKKNLDLIGNITSKVSGDTVTLTFDTESTDTLYFNGRADEEFLMGLNDAIANRTENPTSVYFSNNGAVFYVSINSDTAVKSSGTLDLQSNQLTVNKLGNSVSITTSVGRITFSGGQATNFAVISTTQTSNVILGTDATFYPSSNNSGSIGKSSNKWNNIYGTNGNFDNTTTSSLTVNGKKVFIQNTTPSGAKSGDIWIVTK